jgi:hypothetical protein
VLVAPRQFHTIILFNADIKQKYIIKEETTQFIDQRFGVSPTTSISESEYPLDPCSFASTNSSVSPGSSPFLFDKKGSRSWGVYSLYLEVLAYWVLSLSFGPY